jgi:hypothetical protein
MFAYGVIITILLSISFLSPKFLSYDPVIDGTCASYIWYNDDHSKATNSLQKECLGIYVNFIDYVYIIKLDYWYISPPYPTCQNGPDGVTCTFSSVRMIAEPSNLGKKLAMRISFYNDEGVAFKMFFTYHESVPYDPNRKKFEEYMKWLSN